MSYRDFSEIKIHLEPVQNTFCFKADLHGTTLSHATSLRQAYNMNCFVQIKPITRLRLLCTSK